MVVLSIEVRRRELMPWFKTVRLPLRFFAEKCWFRLERTRVHHVQSSLR